MTRPNERSNARYTVTAVLSPVQHCAQTLPLYVGATRHWSPVEVLFFTSEVRNCDEIRDLVDVRVGPMGWRSAGK